MKKKNYKNTLEVATHLKKVSGKGYFSGHIIEMQLYQKTKQTKKFNQAFLELLNTDEALLSLSKATYKFLFQFSLLQGYLLKYSEQLYSKYVKYHAYTCSIENNIANYYLIQKQYKKAKTHVDMIIQSDNAKCLRPIIVRTLKQQGF